MEMSIYAFDMHSASVPFMIYETGGTFTLKACLIRVAEPLAQWVSESNSWNSTFISLDKGTFILEDTEFRNIGVRTEKSCVIWIMLETGKTLKMERCEFSGGSLDDEGNTIYIKSNNIAENTCVNISNSRFKSCYNENGGGVLKYNFFIFCFSFFFHFF
jgi:hypothetical protein